MRSSSRTLSPPMGATNAFYHFLRQPGLVPALILSIVFALSIVVRLPLLGKPLCHRDEWLSATVLRHMQIWHEMGIANAHFAPIMTYPGAANKNINNNASDHWDREGNAYYTSYPPLAYYVPYFLFQFLHVYPSVLPLQVFNLALHLVTGVFIYLTARILLRDVSSSSGPAMVAFIVYIFSPEPMWLQANVYMSDMFAQPIFVVAIYMLARFLTDEASRGPRFYIGFSVLMFCFVYTEWLGVMFATSLAIFAFRSVSRRRALHLLIPTLGGTAAALLLMAWQYSSINDWRAYLSAAVSKYLFRSGLGPYVGLSLHPWNILPWLLVVGAYFRGFASSFLLLLVLILLTRKSGIDSTTNYIRKVLLYGALLPVILHHLVFFNFTASQQFSVLKSAPLFALYGAVLAARLWGAEQHLQGAWRRVALCATMAIFLVISSRQGRVLAGPRFESYKTIGEAISKQSAPNEIVFLSMSNLGMDDLPPQIVLYAHRNIALWHDEEQARELAQKNGVRRIVVFAFRDEDGEQVSVRRMAL